VQPDALWCKLRARIDALYARELALAGARLAYVFEPLVRADIAAGRLTQVLQATIEEPGLLLNYPRRAAMAPKLRGVHQYGAGGSAPAEAFLSARAIGSISFVHTPPDQPGGSRARSSAVSMPVEKPPP